MISMHRCLDTGSHIDALFLDFYKAFNKVSHRKLCHKLSHYGISGNLLHWIKAFLTDCSQSVLLEGKSNTSHPHQTLCGRCLDLQRNQPSKWSPHFRNIWQMKFNSSECIHQALTRKKSHIHFHYQIHSQQIQQSKSAKYICIRVVIDDHLTWKEHVNIICIAKPSVLKPFCNTIFTIFLRH